ncbi:MAG: NfeD family protein [Lachnospiraceae bacterium]|nr:NfeD family protein [Lachnospiraceae bacterium]
MPDMTVVWLILLVVFLVVEASTMGLTTIWFAGGALVAFLAAIIHAPIWLQVVLFLAVSLLLLFYTRPIAKKYFNQKITKTNVDTVIGQNAIVIEEIDNLQGKGRVILSGQEWSARSVEENGVIAEGAVVEVEAVSGVKLMVREEKITV